MEELPIAARILGHSSDSKEITGTRKCSQEKNLAVIFVAPQRSYVPLISNLASGKIAEAERPAGFIVVSLHLALRSYDLK